MSRSGAKFPVPELVVLLVWIGVTLLILLTVHHHPVITIGWCVLAAYTASIASRQIRQVRRISQHKRRYGDGGID